MKTRINLTVDEKIVHKAKKLAAKQSTSLSQLVEDYLRKLSGKEEEVPFHIQMLGKVKLPEGYSIPRSNKELWGQYCEENKQKYGF